MATGRQMCSYACWRPSVQGRGRLPPPVSFLHCMSFHVPYVNSIEIWLAVKMCSQAASVGVQFQERVLSRACPGAALQVRVGSLSDPDDVPGLAHFTEHMLFYSSEKYPEEGEYRWGEAGEGRRRRWRGSAGL